MPALDDSKAITWSAWFKPCLDPQIDFAKFMDRFQIQQISRFSKTLQLFIKNISILKFQQHCPSKARINIKLVNSYSNQKKNTLNRSIHLKLKWRKTRNLANQNVAELNLCVLDYYQKRKRKKKTPTTTEYLEKEGIEYADN